MNKIIWQAPPLPDLSWIPEDNRHVVNAYIVGSTHVWAAEVDGNLIAIFGVVTQTLLDDTAYLWFMSAPTFDKYKFVFARHSREVIDMILTRYPIIVGHCVTNSAKRWLRWLGGTFIDEGEDVSQFEIRAV